jgi:hypothetical protein
MPQFGTLDVRALESRLPTIDELAREPWETEDTQVLNFTYEIDDSQDLAMIPPALHPSIPFYGNLMLRAHPATSPIGAFRVAEFRIMTRAGVHYGGFVTGGIADPEPTASWLRERYGWPLRVGKITIDHRHYGTEARVELDGRVVFDATLEKPEPISAGDLMYTASFHLARVGGTPELVQTEPSYHPEVAERGSPRVRVFDGEAFGDARLKLQNPLPATYIRGKVGFDAVRYLIDPFRPAIQGTRERED